MVVERDDCVIGISDAARYFAPIDDWRTLDGKPRRRFEGGYRVQQPQSPARQDTRTPVGMGVAVALRLGSRSAETLGHGDLSPTLKSNGFTGSISIRCISRVCCIGDLGANRRGSPLSGTVTTVDVWQTKTT